MRARRSILWWASVLLAIPSPLQAVDPTSSAEMSRVSATLNGVFSPRGFFNILVPLEKIEGVRATKLDLKKSLITIDFDPGISVTRAEMRQVMVDAGYRPGAVTIQHLPVAKASETGPGWMLIKHPHSRHSVIRWFQTNF